jgi:glucosamine-6-phosphate deaminase
MKIKEYKSYDEMSKWVADQIKYAVNFNFMSKFFTLGLATGSTPVGVYTYMVADGWDTSRITTFNLDEYADLPYNHPQSYEHFMEENLFAYKQFRKSYFPSEKNYRNYDVMIQRFPIDIQILGIGTNGHIAFNEPGTPRDSLTRKVKLTQNTIQDNSRFFGDNVNEVPTHAYTMGIESIMRAKQIYLLANGKHKKDILEKACYGEVTSDIPASFLQEHDNVDVLYCE